MREQGYGISWIMLIGFGKSFRLVGFCYREDSWKAKNRHYKRRHLNLKIFQLSFLVFQVNQDQKQSLLKVWDRLVKSCLLFARQYHCLAFLFLCKEFLVSNYFGKIFGEFFSGQTNIPVEIVSDIPFFRPSNFTFEKNTINEESGKKETA